MIDGINIELIGFDCRIWEKNSRLKFSVLKDCESDEPMGSKRAHYEGLTFIIEPKGTARVKGSIHRYYNQGTHNADRFTFENFAIAVDMLTEFGIKADEAILRSFELGVNLDTSLSKIDNKSYLESIVFCKGVKRSDMEIHEKLGYGYVYKTTNAKYKWYDKSIQSEIKDKQLLRVETKFTRMRSVENYSINTLADLLNESKLDKLIVDKFLKPIEETIFFEWRQIPSTRKIPKKYKSKFKDLRNPDWWIKDERSRKERHRNKLLLEKLIKLYAKRDIKNILKGLISLELQAITRRKKGDEYTAFEKLKKWCSENHAVKKGTNAQRIVGCDDQRESIRRYCIICGKDITHQNKNSKYCNDNRKCRDKAYNIKVSEKRKANRSKKEKEILNLIETMGQQLKLVKTSKPKKGAKGKSRQTSIVVKVNGKSKHYHGAQARFFLNEFEKKMKPKPKL
ncbi:hypothetical protein [Marinifilum flexuosum]|uniref:Uncharacterized protein n=1 Tax=Marinifilum flexuosum TaxID=1117708 RepID=A0A419WMP4_9BACT|nr:hypothetical protein [Marinifilum flexuosum]RKD96753.1 hypothetical protein BXY64_3699 [Marinifilum flexuosum]